MTKADKQDLARDLREGTRSSNQELADEYGCSVATVRKYRRVLAGPQ